jgi:hypothetical protein
MPPVVETHKSAEQAMKLVSIKIPESEIIQIRAAAALHDRSISGQAAHWIRLGQAFERDPMVGYSRVERALKAQLSLDQLSGAEQEAYFDKFAEMMRNPSEQDKVAFERAVNYPGAVGLDDNDNLIYASGKPGISEEERAKRKSEVDFARGSCRFEGLVLRPELEAINERYIAGEINSDEHTQLCIAETKRKYSAPANGLTRSVSPRQRTEPMDADESSPAQVPSEQGQGKPISMSELIKSGMPGISEEERAKRKAAVDFARGSCRFEGIILDQDAEELNRRYIDGEITGEEHVALGLALANQKYGTGSVNG